MRLEDDKIFSADTEKETPYEKFIHGKQKRRALYILLSIAIMIFGNNLVQAAVIEGKFDTSNGVNVISGDFISNMLSPGTVPAIDTQIQAALQAGGYSYAPLGMSITGEAR